jgi:hypothetical protein
MTIPIVLVQVISQNPQVHRLSLHTRQRQEKLLSKITEDLLVC